MQYEFITAQIIMLLAFTIMFITPFLAWPSLKNFPFYISIPHFLFSTVGGIFLLLPETLSGLAIIPGNLFFLSLLMLAGSIFYSAAFAAGFVSRMPLKEKCLGFASGWTGSSGSALYRDRLELVILGLGLTSILLFLVSFSIMGFIPLFTDDPMSAKFMAGKFQEPYRPAAPFYRLALLLVPTVIPFLGIFLIDRRFRLKPLYIILSAALLVLTFFTMRRGILAWPLVSLALVYFIYYKNSRLLPYFLVLYLLIFGFGSAANDIIMHGRFDLRATVAGVPDIADLAWFFDRFEKNDYPLALGRTIFGGLIPYQYDWNPAVVTKLVIGASRTAPTGGFRLPIQVWGYINFGAAGVLIWSVISGFLGGFSLSLTKSVMNDPARRSSLLELFLALFALNIVTSIAGNILSWSLDLVSSLFISLAVLILAGSRFRIGKPLTETLHEN